MVDECPEVVDCNKNEEPKIEVKESPAAETPKLDAPHQGETGETKNQPKTDSEVVPEEAPSLDDPADTSIPVDNPNIQSLPETTSENECTQGGGEVIHLSVSELIAIKEGKYNDSEGNPLITAPNGQIVSKCSTVTGGFKLAGGCTLSAEGVKDNGPVYLFIVAPLALLWFRRRHNLRNL